MLKRKKTFAVRSDVIGYLAKLAGTGLFKTTLKRALNNLRARVYKELLKVRI